MMSFWAAQTKVASARDKRSKPIENHTRVEKVDEDTFAIRLHQTNVVLIHRDGTYTLNTGGWHTVTTKARISHYGPVLIGSKRGRWFVYGPGWSERGPFFDGIRISIEGEILNPRPVDVEARAAKETDVAKAAIKKYVELYIAAGKEQIYVDAMESYPEGAVSCWDCGNPTMAGRTTEGGDPAEHLRRHLVLPEFPPELLHTAMKAKGAGPYYFQLIGGASYMVDLTSVNSRHMINDLRKWLRDYLNSQLVDGARKPFTDYSARRAS